jgi:signal transduction histidine kinase
VTRGELDRHVEPGTRDEIGRVTHAFNTMTESLRRTLAELSQRQAVAAVGEFASALAHEIRNPLSAMRLNLQHVQERLPIDAPANEPLRQVLRDIDRLDGTLGSALRIARTGKMSLEPVELRIPLEAAMRIAAPEFERRGVILEPLPVPDRATRMLGDSSALEQLFINLLLNAAQACEPGARAGVRTAVAGDSVTVTVWDTGRGFAPEAKNRAFDPFFTTKAEGTGLGLTVARRIVLAHRGEVAISSAPGGGTEVRVEFPVAATRGTTEVPRGASK